MFLHNIYSVILAAMYLIPNKKDVALLLMRLSHAKQHHNIKLKFR